MCEGSINVVSTRGHLLDCIFEPTHTPLPTQTHHTRMCDECSYPGFGDIFNAMSHMIIVIYSS